MSPEKIGANNTETSEVNDASEVLTNKEKTEQDEAKDMIIETNLDDENADLGINEGKEYT